MRRYLFGVVGVAVLCTGCATVRHGFTVYEALRSAYQPGHNYTTFYQSSSSMAPTIRGGSDVAIVDKSAYETANPQRGDIIAFMPPIRHSPVFIKRVLALPGDALLVRGGRITVNGQALPQSYPQLKPEYDITISSRRILVDRTPLDPAIADIPAPAAWKTADRLPARCYFVIGDNVNLSEDSHVFGCAELGGTFTAGPARGQPATLVGKVVKIIPNVR